ncbi:cytochrome b/b6 domain-containing protein [Acidithiobacillus sp. M4-SHS-6]|uniref:cytochrome b/b6 domain-containing protein n=1 Tax=Acidithiobacillus sp. M4-SHS-6 TaxID=3383024 RepID=UPI0039BEC984
MHVNFPGLHGRQSGSETRKIHQQWARVVVHLTFYGLIFLECALGIWMIGLLGKDLTIGIWHFPLSITPDLQLVYSNVLQWHAAVALSLAVLIGIHSLAALYHYYALHDQLLNNMNIFRRSHSVGNT